MNVERNGETAVVTVDGNLDAATVPGLESFFAEVVSTPGTAEVVLDLSQASWLDSMGLGLLVSTRMKCQERGQRLVLRDVPHRLDRVLVLSGLSELFDQEAIETGAGETDASAGRPAPYPLPHQSPVPAERDNRFEQIAHLTRRAVGAENAYVNFVDERRQVMPGGTYYADGHTRQIPLTNSVCQYVVTAAAPLVVSDTRESTLLRDNGAIEDGVIAYAGMPLTDATGRVVGSLCVVDSHPREWTPGQLETLRDLAEVVSSELHLRSAVSKAAVSADRERLATRLNQEVFSDLLSLGMLLGSAQSITTGKAGELLDEAADKVDDVVKKLRTAVFHAID